MRPLDNMKIFMLRISIAFSVIFGRAFYSRQLKECIVMCFLLRSSHAVFLYWLIRYVIRYPSYINPRLITRHKTNILNNLLFVIRFNFLETKKYLFLLDIKIKYHNEIHANVTFFLWFYSVDLHEDDIKGLLRSWNIPWSWQVTTIFNVYTSIWSVIMQGFLYE